MRYRYRISQGPPDAISLSLIAIKPITYIPDPLPFVDAILRSLLSRSIFPCLVQRPAFIHFLFIYSNRSRPLKSWFSRLKSFLPIKGVKGFFLIFSFGAHVRSKCKGIWLLLQPFRPPSTKKAPDNELATSARLPLCSPLPPFSYCLASAERLLCPQKKK